MMPRKVMPEDLKQQCAEDIAAGKKRGQICKDRGVTYQDLQRTFGYTHKKGPRKVNDNPAESVS